MATLLYSSQMATACASPDLIIAELFFIQLYSHSRSYFAETPLRAGPTAFLFSLRQAAQFALNSFYPACTSGSRPKRKLKKEKNRTKERLNLNRLNCLNFVRLKMFGRASKLSFLNPVQI